MTDQVDFQSLRVLIVEDEDFMRSMIGRLVKMLGVSEVVDAVDGSDALGKLEQFAPDLVILDIMMVPMNGLQFLKAVRTGMSGYRRDVPVIVLTGSADQAVMGTALALDCDAFVAKDKGPEVIQSRIARVVQEPQEIKPAAAYMTITIPDVEKPAGVEPAPGAAPAASAPPPAGARSLPLYEVEAGAVLERDLVTEDGELILGAGAEFTQATINRLSDLAELIDLPDVWVRPA